MTGADIRRLVATGAFFGFAAWVLLGFERAANPMPLVMAGVAGLWLTLLTLAAAGPGLAVWRWVTGVRPEGWADVPLVLGIGSAALAVAAGGLALLGWLRPLPLAFLFAAAAAWGVRSAATCRPFSSPRLPAGARLPALLAGTAFLFAFVLLLTDAPFYDQLHYHLGFPFHWLRRGTVFVLPRHQYSFIAGTMSLLYCYPLVLPGAWAAQAVHWWMGLGAVGSAAVLGHRLAGPRAAAWSAALLATTAPVMASASWAGADLGAAAWGLAGVLAVLFAPRLPEQRRWRAYAVAGALAGAAAGAKILAAATIGAPTALLVLWLARGGWRRRAAAALTWSAGVALALGPWLGRNAAATGNPLHPFGSPPPLLGGPAASSDEQRIGTLASPFSRLGSVFTLTTFAPEGDAGPIGPAFLLWLGPAVWLAGRKKGRLAKPFLAAGAVGLVGWGIGPLWGRYAIPALALLAPSAASGWVHLRRALRVRWRGGADVLAGAVLVWGALGAVTPVQVERLACSLGVGSAGELLRRHVSYWPAVGFVNTSLPQDACILMVAEARSMYLDRNLLIEDAFRVPLLGELAEAAADPCELEAMLRRRGVTHILFNRHEAPRMATIAGRPDLFAGLSAAARHRLETLRRERLVVLFADGPVEVLGWLEEGSRQ